MEPSMQEFASKKIAAGVCGILLGSLGIHKFILGFNKEGIIMIVISIVTCGTVSGIIGLVEGILYLTKTDQQFYDEYAIQKKGWF